MAELTVPVVARLGDFSCQIGVLVITPDADPEVRANPEQLRLAASAMSAVAEGSAPPA